MLECLGRPHSAPRGNKGFADVADGTQMKRFGEAMTKARQHARLSQAALGVQVSSNQSTVSSWERGESEPPPEFVFAIERVCKEPGGSLSRFLGYWPDRVMTDNSDPDPDSDPVELAIMSCPLLDANERKILCDIFVMFANASK